MRTLPVLSTFAPSSPSVPSDHWRWSECVLFYTSRDLTKLLQLTKWGICKTSWWHHSQAWRRAFSTQIRWVSIGLCFCSNMLMRDRHVSFFFFFFFFNYTYFLNINIHLATKTPKQRIASSASHEKKVHANQQLIHQSWFEAIAKRIKSSDLVLQKISTRWQSINKQWKAGTKYGVSILKATAFYSGRLHTCKNSSRRLCWLYAPSPATETGSSSSWTRNNTDPPRLSYGLQRELRPNNGGLCLRLSLLVIQVIENY